MNDQLLLTRRLIVAALAGSVIPSVLLAQDTDVGPFAGTWKGLMKANTGPAQIEYTVLIEPGPKATLLAENSADNQPADKILITGRAIEMDFGPFGLIKVSLNGAGNQLSGTITVLGPTFKIALKRVA
jgi:hypothetical protein